MPDPRPKRFSPTLIAVLSLLAIVVVVAFIRSSTREIVSVRVSPVTHENLVSTVSTNGKVEPITEYRLAAAKTALRAIESAAAAVEHGGTQDERILISGEMTRAQQAQQQASVTLATLKQLQAKGAASVSEVASAQDHLDAADSALKTASLP